MFVTRALARLTMFAGLMALPGLIPSTIYAQQTVTVGATDIGGIVTGAAGPEAGVWVIAETTDLPTKFARIVVTDDQGRYLVPDLPKANYSVWVRGYGLVDSPKLDRKAGPAAQSHRGAGAERSGGGALLSGDLLVLDDENSGRRASSAARATFPRS